MKLESNNLLEKLNTAELQLLSSQVKETLDIRYQKERKKNFGVADLWNVHRKRRNVSGGRMTFYTPGS